MFETRHEKIVITIAAYVIGFTTAFIAFGINRPVVTENNQFVQVNTNTASAVSETSILLNENGLYIRTKKGDQMLSANQASLLSANIISGVETSGVYYTIVDAELSRNKSFVYFCEQLSSNAETCDPFVYDVNRNVLVRVTVNDEEYHSDVSTHNSSWTSDNLLTLDSYISANSEFPWALIEQ